jgi:hypothetical protein
MEENPLDWNRGSLPVTPISAGTYASSHRPWRDCALGERRHGRAARSPLLSFSQPHLSISGSPPPLPGASSLLQAPSSSTRPRYATCWSAEQWRCVTSSSLTWSRTGCVTSSSSTWSRTGRRALPARVRARLCRRQLHLDNNLLELRAAEVRDLVKLDLIMNRPENLVCSCPRSSAPVPGSPRVGFGGGRPR